MNNQTKIENLNIEVLLQVINNIKTPLNGIIEASERLGFSNIGGGQKPKEIIFSNSKQIKNLIDDLIIKSGGKLIEPSIFRIYNSNESVKEICEKSIYPSKISKQDKDWLLKFEEKIDKKMDHCDLNLYDLSFEMSVSERQLHRKIKRLLCITPNKYVRILKLDKAKQYIDDLLYNTVSEVSYAVGYNDTHYFSKLFKNQYGMYPKTMLSKNFEW